MTTANQTSNCFCEPCLPVQHGSFANLFMSVSPFTLQFALNAASCIAFVVHCGVHWCRSAAFLLHYSHVAPEPHLCCVTCVHMLHSASSRLGQTKLAQHQVFSQCFGCSCKETVQGRNAQIMCSQHCCTIKLYHIKACKAHFLQASDTATPWSRV